MTIDVFIGVALCNSEKHAPDFLRCSNKTTAPAWS
jgi:hypothetical protein